VLVMENVGPIDAVKRSAGLLKKTWGEQIAGNFGIGTVFGLAIFAVFVLGFILIAAFASANANALVLLVVILMIGAVLSLSLLSSTLSGIYQAAVYRYATQGEAGGAFPQELVQGAFTVKEKRSGIFG
jgi:predicted neutral ceramidase superfamily lipid hydrolase